MSCEPEVQYTQEDVTGYWEIVAAKRNGNETSTLQGAWMKILGDEMMDNFFTNKQKYKFSLEGSKITHHANPDRKYKIIELTSAKMVLTTIFKKHDFEFTFKKKNG